MVVQLVHLDFPLNLVRASMLNLNGQISAVVETAELTWRDHSLLGGTSLGSLLLGHLLGLLQGAGVSTSALTLLSEG